LRAAQEIAATERATLERELADITTKSSSDISQKVEELAREAAWQRAQVERTVSEQVEMLQRQAQHAVANADVVFADLDRIGAERVDAIRRQAEDALVQSRDYVGQLQDSLGTHLEQLRDRSGELADEMNDRLVTITSASQDTAVRLEQYSRELLEATMTQLSQVSEGKIHEKQSRLALEMSTSVSAVVNEQQAAYERHLSEVGQRLVQTVQGDLSGIAEHARTAVTGELDHLVATSRDHALRAQEQSHLQVMKEIARQQTELSDQARNSTEQAKSVIDNGLRDGRRQLEEAMASMGAHMREEMVRFRDEGERRIAQLVDSLRSREQDMVRDEDRKLTAARQELLRQHEGAMHGQMQQMMSGLSTALGSQSGGNFTASIDRPATPLGQGTSSVFGATPYTGS